MSRCEVSDTIRALGFIDFKFEDLFKPVCLLSFEGDFIELDWGKMKLIYSSPSLSVIVVSVD